MYAKPLCAEQRAVQSNDMAESIRVNAAVGAHWVLSFLSADKKKTYCLYEAPSQSLQTRPSGRSPLAGCHGAADAAHSPLLLSAPWMCSADLL
jgi:Protein of unknown function (DUF4242)